MDIPSPKRKPGDTGRVKSSDESVKIIRQSPRTGKLLVESLDNPGKLIHDIAPYEIKWDERKSKK